MWIFPNLTLQGDQRFFSHMGIWEMKMGIKAAYEQRHKPIVYEKSWESLQWVQPLTNDECLCVCLKRTCHKHRSPLNTAFNHIPKSTLVLRAWSASQGLFGIYKLTFLCPGSLWEIQFRPGQRVLWRLNLISSQDHKTHRGKRAQMPALRPGDQHLLHGGLKLSKTSPLPTALSESVTVLRCWSLTITGGHCFSSSGCVNNPVKHFGRKQPG